jgi:plasmid rolling circle replication initiator protein Rep
MMQDNDLMTRTIEKFRRSQEKKRELIQYLVKHKPWLIKSVWKRKRIKDCGNVLLFEQLANGEHKLRSGSFCKYDKFCLACSTRRAIKMIQRFEQYIMQNSLYKKNWYYIVLTIRHSPSDKLGDLLHKLISSKDQLARRYRNGKRVQVKNKSFFSQFDGMVSSIEITKNKNGWHPHLNLLVCTDNEIQIDHNRYSSPSWKGSHTNEQIRNEWKNITGDSFIHNIRKIDVSQNHFSLDGIGEVFKYAIKFSSLAIDQLAEIVELQQKRKYRFYDMYGIFRRMDRLQDNRDFDLHSWLQQVLSYVDWFYSQVK